MAADTTGQEREWDELYEQIRRVLGAFGREDAFGEGDFWLVDDNYGSPQHKVCVVRLRFLTPEVAAATQRLLVRYSLAWQVLFSLDSPSLRPTEEDVGLVVERSGITEFWDRSRMTKAHGRDFRWGTEDAS
jgi:hypothetical protein